MPDQNQTLPMEYLTYDEMGLIALFRKSFLDEAMWSRAYAFAVLFNNANKEAIDERRFQEPQEAYNYLVSFFGPEVAGRYRDLYRDHLEIYKDLANAMAEKDQQRANAAIQRWYENADAVAMFFSQLSPYWDLDTLKERFYGLNRKLYEHLFSIMTRDYQNEVLQYDALQNYLNLMADTVSSGIIYNQRLQQGTEVTPADESNNAPGSAPANTAENPPANQTQYLTRERMNFFFSFRAFFVNLVYWSRALAVAIKFDMENKEVIFERLLKEQEDALLSLEAFYGFEISDQYMDMVLRYITLFRQLAEAVFKGNPQEVEEALAMWYQNADDIATLFSGINSYWDKSTWQTILYTFNDMVYNHLFTLAAGDYTNEIIQFDNILDQTIVVADYLACGILYRLQEVR